jgi:hypothetical protein
MQLVVVTQWVRTERVQVPPDQSLASKSVVKSYRSQGGPNIGVQATVSSVRSCLASAFSRGSRLVFGFVNPPSQIITNMLFLLHALEHRVLQRGSRTIHSPITPWITCTVFTAHRSHAGGWSQSGHAAHPCHG